MAGSIRPLTGYAQSIEREALEAKGGSSMVDGRGAASGPSTLWWIAVGYGYGG
jgi:hypothetical protein